MKNETAQFQPHVSVDDPELSVYQNVTQILLSDNGTAGSSRRKLEILPQASGSNPFNDVSASNFSGEGGQFLNNENLEPEQDLENCAVLDPQDVSRTVSELQNQSGQFDLSTNCSAVPVSVTIKI